MKNNRPTIYCLMGPTASGKTSIAVNLAQQAPLEIISVDSAQVYRGMDIGAGKPSTEILAKAPHRLINIRDPIDSYSAADFRHDALIEIADIQSKGKTPLLVGGTMLYFKALRDGLAAMPAANQAVRQKILELANESGWQAVHDRLAVVDPESAARIHPNDPQRLQRALEVYELSGKPMTAIHKEGKQQQDLPFDFRFIAIIPEQRTMLHKKIAERFNQMLEQGFIDEVRKLYARGDLKPSLPAIRSVGYRQVWDFLEGAYDESTMQEKALAATRQLAKRQLTWLRSWPDLQIFDGGLPKIEEHCLKMMT